MDCFPSCDLAESSTISALDTGNGSPSHEDLLTLVLDSDGDAERIADQFTLDRLANAGRGELDIDEATYSRLMAGIELGRRIAEAKMDTTDVPSRLDSAEAAIHFCRHHFSRLISDGKQEEMHVITLSAILEDINTHRISVGTLTVFCFASCASIAVYINGCWLEGRPAERVVFENLTGCLTQDGR